MSQSREQAAIVAAQTRIIVDYTNTQYSIMKEDVLLSTSEGR